MGAESYWDGCPSEVVAQTMAQSYHKDHQSVLHYAYLGSAGVAAGRDFLVVVHPILAEHLEEVAAVALIVALIVDSLPEIDIAEMEVVPCHGHRRLSDVGHLQMVVLAADPSHTAERLVGLRMVVVNLEEHHKTVENLGVPHMAVVNLVEHHRAAEALVQLHMN